MRQIIDLKSIIIRAIRELYKNEKGVITTIHTSQIYRYINDNYRIRVGPRRISKIIMEILREYGISFEHYRLPSGKKNGKYIVATRDLKKIVG